MWPWGWRQAFRLEWGPQAPEQGQEGLKATQRELTLRQLEPWGQQEPGGQETLGWALR